MVLKLKTLSLFLNTSFLILFSVYFIINLLNPPNTTTSTPIFKTTTAGVTCTALHDYSDYKSKCLYVKSHADCRPKGYINYLEIFYCNCGRFPQLGIALLLLWLFLLFYILGNTASEYFCPSLEALSKTLNLSPAIAGTTLLPLGNGATDVLASIISFTQSGDGDIGLNSVLGGAFFISSIVVGVLSILITSHQVIVDKPSFIRDVLFLLFSLSCLLMIVVVGRIGFWVAICFASLYILYICLVSAMHFFNSKKQRVVNPEDNRVEEIRIRLLGFVDEEKLVLAEKGLSEDSFQENQASAPGDSVAESLKSVAKGFTRQNCLGLFLYVLELPLDLPRRITIPLVSKERWSKPFAVISVILAPILLAVLWNSQRENMGSKTSLVIYTTAGLFGIIFGFLAFMATKNNSMPPQNNLFLWLAGGFIMSITWTYITAQELVSLLVSLGNIIGLSSSILGLTALAWGNSIGDLISNVAIAIHGGPDGAQIAISGCYAGPIFNVMVGLGLSLVFASWSEYPSPYVIPTDEYLYETIGFLIGGLLWALMILPKKNMRLDRTLGGGLLAIYFCFLFIKIARTLGLLK